MILLAYLVALLYGLLLTYGVVRRRREPRASAVTLAYVWLTLAYVTVVLAFMPQVAENNRIRFFLDPLAVVLVSAAARAALLRAREALSTRR